MATWGELLREINTVAQQQGVIPLDDVRRRALARLHELTGRPIIVYASRWLSGDARPEQVNVSVGDLHAFMEVLHRLEGPKLDLILHSSGGSPLAAEAIVTYLRTKFDDIRVFVPLAAMSAATMIACAGDVIVLGKHSFLGPTDPQLVLQTQLGIQAVPAYAIRKQFDAAQAEAADPKRFPAWIPMLQQYGPGLLVQCDNVLELSEELVREWLSSWMFRGEPEAAEKAQRIAKQLIDQDRHHVHGRFLSRRVLQGFGLKVIELEADQELQDRVLTVFHAVAHTFTFNPMVAKIVENHLGKAFITGRPIEPPPSRTLTEQPSPPLPKPPSLGSVKPSRKKGRTTRRSS